MQVIERFEADELTITQAAKEMGVSPTWARKLVNDRRRGVPDPARLRVEMEERLASEAGAVAYTKRKTTVEPVFGNLKANLRFRRFSQRGLNAVRSEWRLICTIHNLLKLHRHQLATTGTGDRSRRVQEEQAKRPGPGIRATASTLRFLYNQAPGMVVRTLVHEAPST